MSQTTKATMTVEQLRAKWLGRKIYSSTDHRLHGNPPTKEITDIHVNAEDGMVYAWSGEHHRANTVEALDRRLHSLAAN
jgi:hypothetical protein